MVRKTKEETEKTRISLLESALTVFSEKGFVRSTLNDIARQAGVSRGAIYWHFKDKVDLFEALSLYIEDCSGFHSEDLLEEAFNSLDDIGRKLLDWLNKLNSDQRFRTYYDFINFKIEYHAELDPVLARQREVKRLLLQRFMADYTRMQEQGTMRMDIKPQQAALMTLFFFHGLVEIWLFDPELFSLSNDAPGMIGQFLNSFALQPK